MSIKLDLPPGSSVHTYDLHKYADDGLLQLLKKRYKVKYLSELSKLPATALLPTLIELYAVLLPNIDRKEFLKDRRYHSLSYLVTSVDLYLSSLSKYHPRVVLPPDALLQALDQPGFKHREELLLQYLNYRIPTQEYGPPKASSSLHEKLHFLLELLSRDITRETIGTYALRHGWTSILEVGLSEPEFFKGVVANPDYPPVSLDFLTKNNLLVQNPIMEWQVAVTSDYGSFTPTFTPTTEQLHDLLLLGIKKHSTDCWDWFVSYLKDPLPSTIQEAVWNWFLVEATRNQPPSKLKCKLFALLSLLQLPEAKIKADLTQLFSQTPTRQLAALSLRIGYLRVGHKPLLQFAPQQAIDGFIQSIKSDDRAAQAAPLLMLMYFLQPQLDYSAIKSHFNRATTRMNSGALGAQENVQMLTLLNL